MRPNCYRKMAERTIRKRYLERRRLSAEQEHNCSFQLFSETNAGDQVRHLPVCVNGSTKLAACQPETASSATCD